MSRHLAITTVTAGGRRILVSEPFAAQYGHLGLEILMALAMARRLGAAVHFVRPAKVQGAGLFELESADVSILRPSLPLSGALRAWLRVMVARHRLDEWREEFRINVYRRLVSDLERHIARPDLPHAVQREVRYLRSRVRDRAQRLVVDTFSEHGYFRRRLLHERIAVRLRDEAHEQAARQALAHGIDPDAPLICIHNREAGYKRGREVHELKPDSQRSDEVRNGRIESYFPAVDEFVRRGYTVIRLGDPSMKPVARRGVIDVATSPTRSNLLEIYCLLRSDLIVAGESGLAGVSYLTNTPMVVVNVTEPISIYPIRAPGLFVPKAIIDRRDGHRLSLEAQFEQDYLDRFRDPRRYLYIETPPDAIAAASVEMLDWVKGRWAESSQQREYHDAITAAAPLLRRKNGYVRKWGPDGDFLGDGRIAQVAFS